ncbi:uncharacterized protein LOC119916505 [Micropterus salmoides]|uniref:uncharacterized protein LOC119916505 n=1 Tax=Micropterus salmoides TaxID=27706 RepID=UPI0018EB32D6|nr:uncharacterized protein LOC119916505 [Micropterus salmoides]
MSDMTAREEEKACRVTERGSREESCRYERGKEAGAEPVLAFTARERDCNGCLYASRAKLACSLKAARRLLPTVCRGWGVVAGYCCSALARATVCRFESRQKTLKRIPPRRNTAARLNFHQLPEGTGRRSQQVPEFRSCNRFEGRFPWPRTGRLTFLGRRLVRAIDAGRSPVGRTAHHSISLQHKSAAGVQQRQRLFDCKKEARPRTRALSWHYVICAFPRSTLQSKRVNRRSLGSITTTSTPIPTIITPDCSHSHLFLTQLAFCLFHPPTHTPPHTHPPSWR